MVRREDIVDAIEPFVVMASMKKLESAGSGNVALLIFEPKTSPIEESVRTAVQLPARRLLSK